MVVAVLATTVSFTTLSERGVRRAPQRPGSPRPRRAGPRGGGRLSALDPAQLAAVGATGLVAGALNAVAGGGSLITFPVLVAVGLPPLTANVTTTVGQGPGYVGAVVGYRRELAGQGERMRVLGAVAVIGAVIGVAALKLSSQGTFRTIVPALILLASALLAAQPALRARLAARGEAAGRGDARRPLLLASVLAASVYGAYFGAGLGVLLLAALAILVADSLQRLNALNRFLSLVINALAAVAFAVVMPVDWTVAGVLAPATLLGARTGVVLARRLSDRVLRGVVVACGVAAAIYLELS